MMKETRFTRTSLYAARLLLLLCACVLLATAQQPATYSNPVIAGDFPDPSVIRVGQDYWATTTSGNWEPEFLIQHSTDLINWEITGAVFRKRPGWTIHDFWAPEISEDKGHYFVYYTARKKGGPLCVAVATASSPAGPYKDHGPLVCQQDGSIDAAPVTDEQGQRYLIWKEDGNSLNPPAPTIIWAQKLTSNGTKVVGEKKELIRNDKQWEGNVVEGPFILRHGDWFYLFYSGNACCGRKCDYALGVARSRKLLGPWEKNPANPILAANEFWQCPGHGSIVTDAEGRNFLLYHAYRKSEEAFIIGREALLDQVKWGENNWPSINDGHGPSGQAIAPSPVRQRDSQAFFDDFNFPNLNPGWQWSQGEAPPVRIETERGGNLILAARGKDAKDRLASVLARTTTSGDYLATTMIEAGEMKPNTLAGLAAYQYEDNALGIAYGGGRVSVWKRIDKKEKILASVDASNSPQIYLRMAASHADHYRFAWSRDGNEWKDIGGLVSGIELEGLKIALTVGGEDGARARFAWFRIMPRLLQSK